jgi:serine protease
VKRLLLGLILLLTLISGAQAPSFAALVKDEVIVKFRPGFSTEKQLDLLKRQMKLATRRTGYARAFIVVGVPKGYTPATLISRLEAQPDVLYAEQNVTTAATAVNIPNDPYFLAAQWNLQSYGYGIGVDNAWLVSTGTGVPVAVVDTGCAYMNLKPYFAAPDLNPRNIVPLTDWVNNDIRPNDDNGHGTYLCSLIASMMDNRKAIAGIAPDALLMPGKVLDAQGKGKADWLASGITEAAYRGASIILIGCGTTEFSQVVQDAITEASQTAQVVIGSGNEGVDLDQRPGVHALYEDCLIVGASTRDGKLAPYSNYGSAVSLIAPGGGMYDPIWAQTFTAFDMKLPRFGFSADGNGVDWRKGTSVAAAHAAGVLALVKAAGRPEDLTTTARPLSLNVGGQLRRFLLIDAARAVGFSASSGGGSDFPDEEVPPVVDVSIVRFTTWLNSVVPQPMRMIEAPR